MTKEEAITGSIKHWKRMIEWAEKQEGDDPASAEKMHIEIMEKWSGTYCDLCLNLIKDMNATERDCTDCPLFQRYGHCEDGKENPWLLVHRSQTWAEWIVSAKVMLECLESLKKTASS